MRTLQWVAAIALALTLGSVRADLQLVAPTTTGFPGLIRDTGQQLLWLQDTNWAWNSRYQENFMSWHEAMAWADQLVVQFDGTTYDAWRLPTVAEMAYLRSHYTGAGDLPLGTGYSGQTAPGLFGVSRFVDPLAPSADAWASNPLEGGSARYMDMDAVFAETGYLNSPDARMLTWGAVMVPEPHQSLLLVLGLGAFALRAAATRRAQR